MKSTILWVLLVLGPLFCTSKPHLLIKNNKIYDQNGGERIFHGVNLVTKTPPYYDASFGEKDLQKLKQHGINGLRLGVMWPGVEPKQGQFDEQYLQRMVELVNQAGKYNIYTLVEFHQDLFSEKFCGDGVPLWAVPRQVYHSFPIPVMKNRAEFDNQTGLPPNSACSKPWGEYYATKAVNRGFGHLYKNVGGLRDKFIHYWMKVVSAFKDNPYVIAYELMNQPWPGNMYDNPLVMVPGLSETFHLQQLYDQLSHSIRQVDPDHNICFEPVTWLNEFPAGFTHPPGGHRYANSSLLCYHYYNPPTLNLNSFMGARMRDIRRLGGGGLLSQFYTMGAEGVANVAMMQQCDLHSQSWFGWIYQPTLIPEIRRTFAHRVAGTIISQSYNHLTKQYHLLYKVDAQAGETVIYVDMAENYPQGVNVEIYPTLSKAKYDIMEGMYLKVLSGQFQDGLTVMIALSA